MKNSQGRPVALVTGGAVRLGKAIVLALARDGYDIALHYHQSHDEARRTLTEIQACGAQGHVFTQDLSRADDLHDFMREVFDSCPRLSVLVNSASAYTQANLRETDPALFDGQMAVNLRAPVFLTQAFAQCVGEGQVINILDNKIFANQYQYTAYLLAKKGLADFTRMAALELAPRIRVNGVAPGVVLPASTRSSEYLDWRVQGIPLQRQGGVDHVTQAVLSLLKNDFMTGQILVVDGGESINITGRNAGDFDPGKV